LSLSADGLPLALAGLWERWKQPESGEAVHSFTIITTAPNELVAPIHDRMAVILPHEKWAAWLGEREADTDELRWMILRPYPPSLMRAYPVDARVGNVKNNAAVLLEDISVAA
jgi:putative SOS response-associated peptidase YedK